MPKRPATPPVVPRTHVRWQAEWGRRIATVIGIVFYAAVVKYVADAPTVAVYSYWGFADQGRGGAAGAANWVPLALVVGFTLPTRLRRPSTVAIWMLALVTVIPGVVSLPDMVIYDGNARKLLIISLVAGIGIISVIVRLPHPRKLRWSGLATRSYQQLLATLALVFAALVVMEYGVGSGIASWGEMYGRRLEFTTSAVAVNPLSLYASVWMNQVLSLVVIYWGVVRRVPIMTGVGLALQVLGYSIVPTKTGLVLLACGLVVSVGYRWAWRDGDISLLKVAGALSGIWLGITLIFKVPGNEVFASTVMRTLFVPVWVSVGYFEFFSTNAKAFLGQSVFSPFVAYPYGDSIPHIIADHFSAGEYTNLNGHLWADAYANFGLLGTFVFSGILGFVLWTGDWILMRKDLGLVVAAMLGPAASLTNNALLTTLLTFGLGFALLLSWLSPDCVEVKGPSTSTA